MSSNPFANIFGEAQDTSTGTIPRQSNPFSDIFGGTQDTEQNTPDFSAVQDAVDSLPSDLAEPKKEPTFLHHVFDLITGFFTAKDQTPSAPTETNKPEYFKMPDYSQPLPDNPFLNALKVIGNDPAIGPAKEAINNVVSSITTGLKAQSDVLPKIPEKSNNTVRRQDFNDVINLIPQIVGMIASPVVSAVMSLGEVVAKKPLGTVTIPAIGSGTRPYLQPILSAEGTQQSYLDELEKGVPEKEAFWHAIVKTVGDFAVFVPMARDFSKFALLKTAPEKLIAEITADKQQIYDYMSGRTPAAESPLPDNIKQALADTLKNGTREEKLAVLNGTGGLGVEPSRLGKLVGISQAEAEKILSSLKGVPESVPVPLLAGETAKATEAIPAEGKPTVPTVEGLTKIAEEVKNTPRAGGGIAETFAPQNLSFLRRSTPAQLFLSPKDAKAFDTQFKPTPQQQDMRAEATAIRLDVDSGAIKPEEGRTMFETLDKKLMASVTPEQKSILTRGIDILSKSKYNNGYGQSTNFARRGQNGTGNNAGNKGVARGVSGGPSNGNAGKVEQTANTGSNNEVGKTYSLDDRSQSVRDVFPKVRQSTAKRLKEYQEKYGISDKVTQAVSKDSLNDTTDFDAGISLNKDGTFELVFNSAKEGAVTPEMIDHEIGGHVWLSHTDEATRIDLQKSMQEIYRKDETGFAKNLGISDDMLSAYWSHNVRIIKWQIMDSLKNVSKEKAQAIATRALSNAGLIDGNGKIIIPENLLDSSVFFNEKTDAIRESLKKDGYEMPMLADAHNNILFQELISFVAENSVKFADAGTAIGEYATRVHDKTLVFGDTNYFSNAKPVYKGSTDLTLKTLEKLKGRSTVSKTFIEDLTNQPDLKQQERDIIREKLKDYPDDSQIPVVEFVGRVKAELLPLKVNSSDVMKPNPKHPYPIHQEEGNFYPKYESITLPENLRGNVANYKENIYESPIATSAGKTHFDYTTKNYFGHTRIEDMADSNVNKKIPGVRDLRSAGEPNTTRRVIEVQSDLYQKGNLEREQLQKGDMSIADEKKYATPAEVKQWETFSKKNLENGLSTEEKNTWDRLSKTLFVRAAKDRNSQISKLQQYNDPTAHFRMIREEIKKAAQDGKTKLQFPTGETAMKIEGLGRINMFWEEGSVGPLKEKDLSIGREVTQAGNIKWIVTDILGDGKFKAVPKNYYEQIKQSGRIKQAKPNNMWVAETPGGLKEAFNTKKEAEDFLLGSHQETFDISGKVDTSNPIYRFYEKDVARYLSRFGAYPVTDAQGVTWNEVPIKKEYANEPILAFARLSEPTPEEANNEYEKIQGIVEKYGKFPETVEEANKLSAEDFADVFAYLPTDVQYKIVGLDQEKVESPQSIAVDDLLDGKVKLKPPQVTKTETLTTLGKGLYMHIFRKDNAFADGLDVYATNHGFETEDALLEAIRERYDARLQMRDQLREEARVSRETAKAEKDIAKRNTMERKAVEKRAKALVNSLPTQRTTEGSQTKKVIKETIKGKTRVIMTTEDVLLKNKLKEQARGARAGFKAGYVAARDKIIEKFNSKITDSDQVRGDIVEFIKDTVPLAKQGRFMTIVRDAKTVRDMVEAFGRIMTYTTELEREGAIRSLKESVKKALNSSKIDVVYKQKIEDAVSGFELTGHNESTIENLQATKQYLEEQRSAGNEVYLPKRILERLDILSRIPKNEITIDQLEGLQNEIELLTQLGETRERTRQELYELEKEAWQNKLDGEIVTVESKLPTKRGIGEQFTFRQKMIERYKKAYNALQLKRLVLRPMDGVATITGMSAVKDSLDISFSDYLTRNNGIIEQYDQLRKRLGITDREMERTGVFAIKEQEGGYEKLENLGISRAEADAIVLTPEEKEYYDFVRKTFDSMYPEVKTFMRDVYNEDVGQVKNYVSFITDFEAMSDFEIYQRYGTLADETMNRKNVEQGFTKERQGAGTQKIKINLEQIFLRHIDDVSYMLSMGKPIKMFSEIIKTPEIAEKLGDVGAHMWAQYLDLMARKGGIEGAKKVAALDFLRKNLGVAMMSYKLSSALVQLGSFADGAATIGGDWMINGASKIATSKEWRAFIMENFPEIKNAVGDDIAFRELNDTWFGKIGQVGLEPLKRLDGLMRATTAAGAYMKLARAAGIEVDLQNPNKTLLAQAQKLVRQSQGSSLYKDAPLAISKGMFTGNKSVDKMIFQFQSFLLSRWENIEEQIWRQGFKKKDYKKAVSGIIWLLIVAGATEFGLRKISKKLIGLITGDNNPDTESWIHGTIKNALGNIPILGSLMNSVAYDSNPIPVIATGEKAITGAKNVIGGKTATTKEKALTDIIAGLGGLAGIPGILQIAGIAKNLIPEPPDVRAKNEIRQAYQSGDKQKAEALLKDAVKNGYIKQQSVNEFKANADYPDDIIKFKNMTSDGQLEKMAKMSVAELNKYAWFAHPSIKSKIKTLSSNAADFVAKTKNGTFHEPVYKMGKLQ